MLLWDELNKVMNWGIYSLLFVKKYIICLFWKLIVSLHPD